MDDETATDNDKKSGEPKPSARDEKDAYELDRDDDGDDNYREDGLVPDEDEAMLNSLDDADVLVAGRRGQIRRRKVDGDKDGKTNASAKQVVCSESRF